MATRLKTRIGLRGRVALLLLAAFAALYALAMIHALNHRAEMVANAGDHLLHNAKLIAARQQFLISHADTILSDLKQHPALQPDQPAADCSGVLAERLRQEPEFANLLLARPDGEVACSATPAAKHVNLADRAYFGKALATRDLVISDVTTGHIVGTPIIVLAKAMPDRSGNATGVVALSLDLARLHAELAGNNLPEGARLVVLDNQGSVAVRHPNPEGWVGRNAAAMPVFRVVAAQKEGIVEETGLDGVKKLIAFTPLLETASGQMTIYLSMPMATVMAPAQRELNKFVAVLILVLLLTLGLLYWGGNAMLLRPLTIISRQWSKYAGGDFTVRSGLPHGNDEVGQLARMLDDTADRIETGAQRFRAVAEASLDALFILKSVRDADGRITDFEFADLNARAEALLDKPREQVIGQKLCELIPVNRSGGFFDKYVAVVETGTPLEEEFSLDAPEIRAKWLRHQVVRVGDGIAISSRDITSWKKISAEIRRQDRLRKLILESSGDGIFGVDTEGRATFVNPAACAMLQWTEEELLGQVMHALHHHTRADGTPYPREECPIYRAFLDGVVHAVDDELFWRKDGSSFPVEYTSTPTRDEAGELVGAVVSFRDTSERKQAEVALQRMNRALKTLSASNQELVRATGEQALLEAACRVVVEQGGYRMAWVGYAGDTPEKPVMPKAWAGAEEGYLEKLDLTWADDSARGQGPSSRAIRSGEVQIARDIRSDPGFAPWRALAEKHGFASNFTMPLKVNGSAIGILSIYAAEPDAFDAGEVELLTELGNDLAFGIETLRTRAERDRTAWQHLHHAEILQKSMEQSIQAIAAIVDARDPYTAGHQRRVADLAAAIAREMGLPEERIHGIHLAGVVHDLGKIRVPAEILAKPGKLTDIEFMLIKVHPQAGYEILKDVEFPWPIADIVRQHHEKLDGSGYPQGLKGGEILLESRIMTVADVVEAMGSHRPYRPTLGIDAALAEIERGRGTVYDATVADACLKLFSEKKFAFEA